MNNLILIGMMGCGKSTVGRLAAEKLGLAFVDTDERIEAEAGRTIPELFDAEGEEGFRHLEEYIDARTERYARMVDGICKNLRVTSLRYQTLEGMLASIGIDPEQVCTYCWTGRE